MPKYKLVCGNTFYVNQDTDGVKRLFSLEDGKFYPELMSDYLKRIMNKPRAEFVRNLVIKEGSKDPEKIGRLCSDEWNGDWGVTVEWNLDACFWRGTALIRHAAKFLGEDISDEPWNLKNYLN